MQLIRSTHPFFDENCGFDNLFDHWEQYEDESNDSKMLKHLIKTRYSKVSAVDTLCDKQLITPLLARALLTDRGLLFAETREVGYPIEYSKRRLDSDLDEILNIARGYLDSEIPRGSRIRNESLDALVSAAVNKWKICSEENIDQASFKRIEDHIRLMLMSVLKRCASLEYFSKEFIHPGYDIGYIDQNNEEQRKAWVTGYKFRFPKRTKEVFAALWLRKHVEAELTDAELFVFLSKCLPAAVTCAGLIYSADYYRTIKSRKHTPCISSKQLIEFEKQINDFKKEDLSAWKNARSVLKEWYAPNTDFLDQYRRSDLTNCELLDPFRKALSSAIRNYYAYIEGNVDSATNHHEELANLFFSGPKVNGFSSPEFMKHPVIIFQIIRSPVYRYLYDESRAWSIKRAVHDAFTYVRPISIETLQAEENLYHEILHVCEKACNEYNITTFSTVPWENLWTCIKQTVNCLSYGFENLLSPPILFKSGYQDFHRFFPILDTWLRDKFSEENRLYEVDLWKTIHNAMKGKATKDSRSFHEESVALYRKQFISSKPDYDFLLKLLYQFAGEFGWNKIAVVPTMEELELTAEDLGYFVSDDKDCHDFDDRRTISRKTIQNFVSLSKARSYEDTCNDLLQQKVRLSERHVSDLQMVLIERYLLQQICHNAQTKLLKTMDCMINITPS